MVSCSSGLDTEKWADMLHSCATDSAELGDLCEDLVGRTSDGLQRSFQCCWFIILTPVCRPIYLFKRAVFRFHQVIRLIETVFVSTWSCRS